MTKKEILDYLKNHKKEFAKRYGISRIGLFGSYGREENMPKSDIDIYVEFRQKSFDNLAGLWVCLEESFGQKVDLVYPRKGENPKILEEIRKKVIYG